MSVIKLKKINVRSPYYISVEKPVSEGGEGDDPDVVPTEPLTRSFDTTCGATVSVGTDVGVVKYNLSSDNKQLGDYSITFSNIKVPIKYRIGHANNMPSYSTAGLDTYATIWNTATGESPTLSSASANPNGVSATATYTSTQSDIDTYGSIITLEIQQPIIVDEGYSFTSSCPANLPEQEPTVTGFVSVLTVTALTLGSSEFGTLRVNNVLMESGEGEGEAVRYIFSDISPDLVPKPSTGNDFFIRDAANTFIGNVSGIDVSVAYINENTLSRGKNIITYEPSGLFVKDQIRFQLTRHPVIDINGTSYILGNADEEDLQYFDHFLNTRGYVNKMTLEFNGGNTDEFSNASYSYETRYTDTDVIRSPIQIGYLSR